MGLFYNKSAFDWIISNLIRQKQLIPATNSYLPVLFPFKLKLDCHMAIFGCIKSNLNIFDIKKKDVPGYSPRNAFFMRSNIDS